MKLLIQKSDTIGAYSSSLCFIHCIATPFLFLAQTSSVCCHKSVPLWWQSVDYIFLIVSFFAVYRSTQTTSNKYIKPTLWISWIALFTVIINEKFELLPVSEILNYIPALILVMLHLFNRKYCQCKTDTCCTKNE